MADDRYSAAIKSLEKIAAELEQIHRPKHYALWVGEATDRLNTELAEAAPFNEYRRAWIYTGDGGGVGFGPPFGSWAIDQLRLKTPAEVMDAFAAEIERNSADYMEISPIVGIQIDGEYRLKGGETLVTEPALTGALAASVRQMTSQWQKLPLSTAYLFQPYTVTPAFNKAGGNAASDGASGVTFPKMLHRSEVRERIRLACLLAIPGPVEIPFTVLRPVPNCLFVGGEGSATGRPFSSFPVTSYPVEATTVERKYDSLGKFKKLESLARAIDRLGRSRLAATMVDRALELGIAAELALMHDHKTDNTEIAHKIGSRAAWLLGQDSAEREAIFKDMKNLYQARSQAVHSGALASKSNIDLGAADRLVARTLNEILKRGSFPNWNSLTMGGDGLDPKVGRE